MTDESLRLCCKCQADDQRYYSLQAKDREDVKKIIGISTQWTALTSFFSSRWKFYKNSFLMIFVFVFFWWLPPWAVSQSVHLIAHSLRGGFKKNKWLRHHFPFMVYTYNFYHIEAFRKKVRFFLSCLVRTEVWKGEGKFPIPFLYIPGGQQKSPGVFFCKR